MSSVTRPIVIAHRGASGYRPEHTRSAFESAIALGADAVEPDLVASRDGVLVIRHENEISQTTDVADRAEFADRRTTKSIDGSRISGWFTEDFSWDELATLRCRERLPTIRPGNAAFDGQERMLRLEDLLALLDQPPGAPVGLVAELKHASYFRSIGLPIEPLLLAALGSAGWDADDHRDRVTVESFELTALAPFAAMRTVYLIEADGSPSDRPGTTYASSITPEGLADLSGVVDGISVDKRVLLDRDAAAASALVDRARASGLLVYAWTLRAENHFLARRFRSGGRRASLGSWRDEFAFVMATGVDGVFADQPDLAIEARGA